MTYTVLVHDAEEGGYWAEVPELPGCLSQGETLEELERNIVEAIEACVAVQDEEEPGTRQRVRRWDLTVPDRSERRASA